jgi:hypothetical protein
MENGLELGPDSVSCPSTTLCVFTGRATQFAGQQERAVAVSTGPFVPGRQVTGRLTDLPLAIGEDDTFGPWYVSCPSTTACIMSSPDALYATTSPLTGPWVIQLTAPSGEEFGDISCAGITFCAVILGRDILISRSPLGGAGTWSRSNLMDVPPDEDEGVSVLSCPSPELCVAGGSGGFIGGWIEESSDPGGGAGAWSGGEVTNPGAPQHSGEYSIEAVSCPTTALCVAVEIGGPLLVSSDPASGPASWHLAPTTFMPYSDTTGPGVASCSTDGTCVVSGAGIFPSSPGAAGPGFAGYPQFQVSCVTISFCVSIDAETDNQLAVGGIGGTAPR